MAGIKDLTKWSLWFPPVKHNSSHVHYYPLTFYSFKTLIARFDSLAFMVFVRSTFSIKPKGYPHIGYTDIESVPEMIILQHSFNTLCTIESSKSLPLFWGVCFPLPDWHTSASNLWPPAAQPPCLLKGHLRCRDAPWQIWEKLVKESTASNWNEQDYERFSLIPFMLRAVGGTWLWDYI